MPCRFFFHAVPDFGGHGRARFLEDVADEADGARHHAQAFHDLPVEAELAGEGADGAGGVQGNVLFLRDRLHELAVLAVEAGLAGDLEEAHAPRVERLVDRVAEAGNALVFRDDRLRVLAG